ncbi:hypothetical protein [Pseudoalteromonas luteoviolacea]|uniref:Uncharacterized protein n=1 Tax=Pseudoalteromonas luteoviolacea DSM 6061 TaxID=1365250 RepID=A0A162A8R9_9GAMM|nr:hypothetical protein [Pseudoalteromonas luteoviolacea]KZN45943.1 hypothetical protein N475_25730 [Pseudoalteromonas luteoviolacea DSM 6061]MBE0385403.1 hypothetical protein [Pseudoalteromonas luteoviolacea DSM 6061]
MPQELYLVSLVFSCLALIVSGVTAWLTFFCKGELVMTQPTVVFFGPDGSNFNSPKNKIYLRTLLYSTSKRGQVIESLHVSIQRNESKQNFNVWVYGEKGDLKRGSGLFVPQEGVTADHHFLLPEDGADFKFFAGKYNVVVFAKLVGSSKPNKLSQLSLEITDAQAASLNEPNTGLYHDWGPDQQSYHAHINKKPENEPDIEGLMKLMANKALKSDS